LSLISGILRPTGGDVLIDGKPVTGPSRKVGYMLQQDYLFEWRTILDNAVLGAEIQGADMHKARERGAEPRRACVAAGFYGSNVIELCQPRGGYNSVGLRKVGDGAR
jgi:NitT/TauT family transport system ATP-binding protein